MLNQIRYLSFLLVTTILFISITSNVLAFNNDNTNESFTFAAVGDWGCKKESNKTVQSMVDKNTDIILGLGDYSYEKNMDCWIDMIENNNIDKSNVFIAIGNHELESKSLVDKYMNYFNMENQYHSFNYENVHFLSLSTEVPYEKDSKQYEFVIYDLVHAYNDPEIDWIVVYFHKPIYSSDTKHEGLDSFRETYHPIFDDFDVDLVLQGHNHNYQRTYPISYNYDEDAKPVVFNDDILNDNVGFTSLEDSFNINNNNKKISYAQLNLNDIYEDPNAPVFIVAGTGGKSLYKLKDQENFVSNQFAKFGFIQVSIEENNNNNELIGKFYSNEGEIEDSFKIIKPKNSDNDYYDYYDGIIDIKY